MPGSLAESVSPDLVRDGLKENKVETREGGTQSQQPLASVCMYTCLHAHTCMPDVGLAHGTADHASLPASER